MCIFKAFIALLLCGYAISLLDSFYQCPNYQFGLASMLADDVGAEGGGEAVKGGGGEEGKGGKEGSSGKLECGPKAGPGPGPGATDGKNCGLNITDPRQTASNIAQKAAQDAKAASDAQMPAAEEAALQVKANLADKAAQSARAAEAALAGKQQILERLEKEMKEANAVVVEVTASLKGTHTNADSAATAAQVAVNELNEMKILLENATSNLAIMKKVANSVKEQVVERTQLVEAAKTRVANATRRVAEARKDFEKTKEAATKALCAAMEAKQKAPRKPRMESRAEEQTWLHDCGGEGANMYVPN